VRARTANKADDLLRVSLTRVVRTRSCSLGKLGRRFLDCYKITDDRQNLKCIALPYFACESSAPEYLAMEYFSRNFRYLLSLRRLFTIFESTYELMLFFWLKISWIKGSDGNGGLRCWNECVAELLWIRCKVWLEKRRAPFPKKRFVVQSLISVKGVITRYLVPRNLNYRSIKSTFITHKRHEILLFIHGPTRDTRAIAIVY